MSINLLNSQIQEFKLALWYKSGYHFFLSLLALFQSFINRFMVLSHFLSLTVITKNMLSDKWLNNNMGVGVRGVRGVNTNVGLKRCLNLQFSSPVHCEKILCSGF